LIPNSDRRLDLFFVLLFSSWAGGSWEREVEGEEGDEDEGDEEGEGFDCIA